MRIGAAATGRSAACALVMLIAALAAPAAAQPTLWRCGPDGRVFTDRPCPGGTAVAPAPRPTPQARAEAHAVAARERDAAQRLAQERRQRHADALRAGGGAAGIGSLQAASARPPSERAAPTRRARATTRRTVD